MNHRRWWPPTSTMLAGATSTVLIAWWWLGTTAQPLSHIDHLAFLRTIEYMQAGEGYYAAMQRAFHDIDVTIGHARGYRIPTAFLLWRWIPSSLLWGTFMVVVVGGSTWLAMRLARNPWSAVAVTLFMLLAGRSVWTFGFDSWMLVELWLVPLAMGSVLAWRREHDWIAAGLALAATMTRETAAVFVLGGLLAALIDSKRKATPWITALAIAVVGYAAHFALAADWVEPPGNFAKLFGTGDPPRTVLAMAKWTIATLPAVGLLLWLLGGWGIWRSRERWLLLPVLLMPLNGFIVDRPYWGIMLIPFLLIYGVDEATAGFRRAGSAASTGAGSSQHPGTPAPGRGNQEVGPAPPSG